jgi:hypothetical protein
MAGGVGRSANWGGIGWHNETVVATATVRTIKMLPLVLFMREEFS